jgi:hypothetical protein
VQKYQLLSLKIHSISHYYRFQELCTHLFPYLIPLAEYDSEKTQNHRFSNQSCHQSKCSQVLNLDDKFPPSHEGPAQCLVVIRSSTYSVRVPAYPC